MLQINRFMFLQMELHTQATGAACYARIVAHDLVHQGILSENIDSEVSMVLNPTSLDFGTIYIGNESTFK